LAKVSSLILDGAFGGFLVGTGLGFLILVQVLASDVASSDVFDFSVAGFVVILIGVLALAIALHRGSRLTISH